MNKQSRELMIVVASLALMGTFFVHIAAPALARGPLPPGIDHNGTGPSGSGAPPAGGGPICYAARAGGGIRDLEVPIDIASDGAAPTRYSPPAQTSGRNGVPTIQWPGPGLNARWAVGPYPAATVNGGPHGTSVHLGNGAAYKTATDLSLALNGIDWSHIRMYSSLASVPSNWQGEGWWASEMAYITVAGTDGSSDVTVYFDPHFSLSWTYDSETFFDYLGPEDGYPFSIDFVGGSDEYQIRRKDGMLWVFHDGAHTNAGKLKRLEDPYGNDQAFTYSSGKLTDIVIDVVDGNDHKITYTYFSGGDNDGKLQYIKAYKSTTTTSANLIGQVEYVYHDSASDSYGTNGDLMKVIVSHKATTDGDGTLSIESTYRYRYYKSPWSASGPLNKGTDHQLRYVLNPENAQRLNDDIGAPDSQSNDDWEDYANVYYEYESSSGRVTKTDERLPGSGCGCGGGGGAGTTEYTWTVNGSTPNLDTWKVHCVADREDNTRVIFDVNRRYQILTWVLQDEDDGSPTREQIWHFDYDTVANRVTQIHYPSACSAYDEGTYAVTLRSSEGLVYELDYDYPGVGGNNYDGFLEKIRIKQGTGGTANTLIAYGRTITARPDLATTITHYESSGEADGRTTTLTYTFYDGAKYQPKQLDISYPVVTTAKNGPNVAAVDKQFYDKRTGALRWTLDGEGYVAYHAYDSQTGVENFTVVDANTSSLLGNIDTTWDGVAHGGLGADDTVPFSRTGGGTALDIDSSSVIDWLGRTRKSTDAGGSITYHVYKDDETRSYPAWNTSSYVTLLPIQVAKMDKEGHVEDSIELKTSVTPSVDGSNEPTGTESYGNSDMASRTVTTYTLSGGVSNVKRYHTMAVSGDGTRYTNYYQTDTEYDSMGRVEYTIEDVSDESSYDREQVTRHYYDFLGRQTKTSEGVSDNSHDISGGKPTLNTTVEYFFDDPDTDATPEQGDGDGNLTWVRKYHGTSSYNDTNFRYDWRNRRGLTIPPGSPYTLVKYDNLDRVTTTGRYSSTSNLDPGDDPATTEYANRVALTKTYFDERGRVYRSETYDDPSDSTPADELASDTFYDRRGLVWASDPANTGISFTVYDGAGRRTQTFSGTQFDSAKYTSDAPDYPDDNEGIVQLTEYTLNDVGNVTKTISKELNHDDTNGMNLSSSDYIRTYVYSYYDAAHRLMDTVNYGTNNSNGWKDYSTPPTYDNDGGTAGDQSATRSDTALVTSYTYDSEGRQEKIKDPKAIDTKSVYDKLGRVTQKEEDDGGGTERITTYQYNGQGSVMRVTTDTVIDSVTEQLFESAQNSRWVTTIKYPATDTNNGKSLGQPSTETYDQIAFTYNNDGTLATRTDQNGTVLTWSYDSLRRKTEEEVTTVGSFTGGSVDSAIRSFTWTYDSEGRIEYVTSHTDTTPDTSTWTDTANQVKYTYNAAGKLTKEEQEEDGKVDGSTLSVEYGYGTDYSSSYYNRQNWIEYPDGRKIWFGYTHSGGGSTFQDTINDTFNRIGQIARDNSGSKGDLLAEYDFNGMHRQVRRVHDEDSGKYGNDTRMDLWHGTTGQYDGLDRFGRIVDMRQVDFNGSATNFLRLNYAYDRNGNRTLIEDSLYKAESQTFTYDTLNRLTQQKRGVLLSSSISSNAYENFNMDLLGNFTASAGGVKVNTSSSVVTQDTNATNEISSLDRPNPSGAKKLIDNDFTSIGSSWTQSAGSWSAASSEYTVNSLASGHALLLNSPTHQVANYAFSVKVPTSGKGGLVFGHDGSNNYWAVVFKASKYVEIYQVTGGSWGSPVASGQIASGLLGSYVGLRVVVKTRSIEVLWYNFTSTDVISLRYDSSTEIPAGLSGLYADTTGIKFQQYTVLESTARDPKLRSISGAGAASRTSNELLIANANSTEPDVVKVDNFADDDYMVQANVDFNSEEFNYIWVRFTDIDNGYRIYLGDSGTLELHKFVKGERTVPVSTTHSAVGTAAVKVKVNGTSIKVWVDSNLDIDTTDSSISYGGVAFDGEATSFDNLKIGYDNNSDNDIDDVGDDLVMNEDFSGSSATPVYDHAGNLVEDAFYRYTYDAWNRLVKVQAKEDSAVVTIQTSEFDALGRRIKKVVTNSGNLDKTEVYLFDGQKIIETRNGSGTMVQQFIHGTQYIDELVMVRVKDKGDLYIHQDANWNVIGTTDLGRHIVERNVYSPYGELTVEQKTGFGDRDGDGDVDSTDKGTVGVTCTGTVTTACRIMDLDFDGDYDSTDATKFDALPQGLQRTPGKLASAVQQPFAHQGLLFEPEIGSYQNRGRVLLSGCHVFAQRDPVSTGGATAYLYEHGNPTKWLDPIGTTPVLRDRVVLPETDCGPMVIYDSHIINASIATSSLTILNNAPCSTAPVAVGCSPTRSPPQQIPTDANPQYTGGYNERCTCSNQGIRFVTATWINIYRHFDTTLVWCTYPGFTNGGNPCSQYDYPIYTVIVQTTDVLTIIRGMTVGCACDCLSCGSGGCY